MVERQADPNFTLPGMSADTLSEWERLHPPFGDDPPAPEPTPEPTGDPGEGVQIEDFYAYMPQHNYIYAPSREPWPKESIDGRLGKGAHRWLDQNRPVEQLTWAPGLPMIITNRLISEGGWIRRKNVSVFNLYRPPLLVPGDPDQAGRWIAHVDKVYPEDAEHIRYFLGHRVQRPHEKINHALVLGGLQGIGKDSLIEPAKRAVGPWNVAEPSPEQLAGKFNGFAKSVILRISEAHDLGEIDRYSFYEHLKVFCAAPPDVLRVNEKHLREYNSLNCCAVIITTNHKTDGIFLPADDRRHYVAWSFLVKEDFTQDYWDDLWGYYDNGGDRHVAAYLAQLDLSGFNPKAPPKKTAAFWDIANASRVPEDAELADCLDHLGNLDVVTMAVVLRAAEQLFPSPPAVAPGVAIPRSDSFADWLKDRRNRRVIPHRFEACGYVPIRNPDADDGLWKIGGRRVVAYVKASLSFHQQLVAVRDLVKPRARSV
jgi:hypothetical protein